MLMFYVRQLNFCHTDSAWVFVKCITITGTDGLGWCDYVLCVVCGIYYFVMLVEKDLL